MRREKKLAITLAGVMVLSLVAGLASAALPLVNYTGDLFRPFGATMLCAKMTQNGAPVVGAQLTFEGDQHSVARNLYSWAKAGPVLTNYLGVACRSANWSPGVYNVYAYPSVGGYQSLDYALTIYRKGFQGLVGGGALQSPGPNHPITFGLTYESSGRFNLLFIDEYVTPSGQFYFPAWLTASSFESVSTSGSGSDEMWTFEGFCYFKSHTPKGDAPYTSYRYLATIGFDAGRPTFSLTIFDFPGTKALYRASGPIQRGGLCGAALFRPGAVAMAGVSPDVTGRWGDGGILLAWNAPKDVGTRDILEYHIWMDNYGNVPPDSGGTRVGPVLAIGRDNAFPLSNAIGSFDYSTVIDTSGFAPFTYSYTDADHQLQTATVDSADGIVIGRTHQFWVSALYRRLIPSTGAFTWWETTPVSAGRATYVSRPSCIMPDQATDLPLSNITFEWTGSTGADRYRLEVSTSPSFERSTAWCTDVYAPTSSPVTFSRTFIGVLNDAPELANVQAGQTLYWRVGARKSTDNPGPYPAGPSAAVSGPKNTRFIYCDMPFEFTIDAPPDGGDDGGGGPPGPPNI